MMYQRLWILPTAETHHRTGQRIDLVIVTAERERLDLVQELCDPHATK
jgi:hypothetical protein